jgi:hypothetical protein
MPTFSQKQKEFSGIGHMGSIGRILAKQLALLKIKTRRLVQ